MRVRRLKLELDRVKADARRKFAADVRRFIRAHPLVALGGGALLGALIAWPKPASYVGRLARAAISRIRLP